jgi:hypothetical protein
MVLGRLEAEEVPLDAIRRYFSDSKGFHAELPHTLFHGFEPSTELHRLLETNAVQDLDGGTFDGSAYDKPRLWRVPTLGTGQPFLTRSS